MKTDHHIRPSSALSNHQTRVVLPISRFIVQLKVFDALFDGHCLMLNSSVEADSTAGDSIAICKTFHCNAEQLRNRNTKVGKICDNARSFGKGIKRHQVQVEFAKAFALNWWPVRLSPQH